MKVSTVEQRPIQFAPTKLRSKTVTSESPGKHSGIREVRFVGNITKQTSVCQMTFHVTDASKILASVSKMTEAGNDVVFKDPRKEQSYILSESGNKAFLKGKTASSL